MDDINKLNETGGAGDWGTDKARAKLQKDTPGQEITKGKKMKTFKDILNNIDECSTNINENYAQDLDLAQKNMARLAKQEKGQEKKDYMAVARALNQGNLGAVKKIIKGISTDEIKADILNVLVGYNNLIAKMYPKAVDAKGRLKTPMSVSKLIKDEVNEIREMTQRFAFDNLKKAARAEKLADKYNLRVDSGVDGKIYYVAVTGKFTDITKWMKELG